MSESSDVLEEITKDYQKIHTENKVILTFGQFLDQVKENPRRFIRNSWQYIVDAIDHFGCENLDKNPHNQAVRYKIFDIGTEEGVPIISGEVGQSEIYSILKSFNYSLQGSKLILLHGPNGSAKSSTVETISHGLQIYSSKDNGAIYKFNWIFPSDKESLPQRKGESSKIGFGSSISGEHQDKGSYALLEDYKIASKLASEFKENPLYIIPMPYREKLLREWISAIENSPPDQIELPPHILGRGLSKKNYQIFESLLNAYGGDFSKVCNHIQIERFYFSKQYRVGISTVEPQMSIDAREKQLTLDKNFSNLPAVLHAISFFQSEGELIEANRGMLEFSDLLKRPLESFKYLLNTIEKASINLISGTANLDITFFATTNEKHLDSFKTIPDFSSFKGRMEFVTVPYLLLPNLEEKIYKRDILSIQKSKKVSPHAISSLCYWSVMTRLKQPDPELYPEDARALISKIDPYSKVLIFEEKPLQPMFSIEEQNILHENKKSLWNESQGMVVYEGRFGASPREIRSLLHRCGNNKNYQSITPVEIFEELEKLTKDRTVYEFLQFEPRAQYHDAKLFIEILKERFVNLFESEILDSMAMADDQEYDNLLKRYVDHVVAEIKKEKILDPSSNSYHSPSETLMSHVEEILGITKEVGEHRTSLLSRIAAFRLENPKTPIRVGEVFYDYLSKIKAHFYQEKNTIIEKIYQVMLTVAKDEYQGLEDNDVEVAKSTFNALDKKYGYDFTSAVTCLKFLVKFKKNSNAVKFFTAKNP